MPRGNSWTSSNAGCLITSFNSFVANMTEIDSSNDCDRSCGPAFMMMMMSNWTHVNTTLQWGISKCELYKLNEDSNMMVNIVSTKDV